MPYFCALEALPLLDREQEQALAREIDRLVVEHWRVMLSYRPALAAVGAALEQALPGSSRALAPLLQRRPMRSRGRAGGQRAARNAALAAAVKLRRRDLNGAALRATRVAVQASLGGNPHARAFLSRVASAHAAEQAAKGRFVTANLRLVIAMASRYDRTLLSLADMIQEGNLGLMRAVEGFDHRRGLRFSTYATWWIRQGIHRALADKGRLIRVPVHALEDLARIRRATSAASALTGVAPDLQDLATLTGLAADKLAALSVEGLTRHPLSLDRGIDDDNDRTLHEALSDPSEPVVHDSLDLARRRDELERLLARLSPIEAETLRLRYGLNGEEHTLSQVGVKYNLSRERIRQIQAAALVKLRELLGPEIDGNGKDGLAA